MRKKYLLFTYKSVNKLSFLSKERKIVSYIVLTFLLSFMSLETTVAQDTFEVSQNGWANATGDQLDWTRDSGGTPSGNTGPSAGAGGSTWYMYLETSDPAATGNAAWLEKVYDFRGKESAQLVFDLHMYGATMGTLNVLVNDGGVLTNIFSLAGDQGNQWLSTNPINLSGFVGKKIKLRFEAIKGSSFTGDIAIDNVNVTTQAPSLDSDGDGFNDDVDLDDDNDGILDTDEGCESVASSAFNLVPAESVLGDINSGGKLVYKDAAGNTVILEAAGSVGSNNGITTGTPNDGTVINDINNGEIVFEVGASDVEDQPKLRVSTFSADGVPFKISSIGLGGINDMDNSTAQDAIAIDVPGKWSNLTAAGNTLALAQIITQPPGAEPVPGNTSVTQAQLDDFDFNNFVAQGAVSEVIFNIGNPSVEGPYNATFSPTTPTSTFNLIVDDIKINNGGIRNILTRLATTTITIESVFCRDTDGDGIPDYLDIDSDNDGCTDANEAYFNTVPRADNNDDGFYGSGTPSVDGSGKVSGASYGSPNPYYIDNSVVACFDTDNDQVPNNVDLDDDNDGVLDTVECPPITGSVAPQADALTWFSNGTQVFVVGNNTNGLGYQESGFQQAVYNTGKTVTTLNGVDDFTFSGNTATFSNGTATLNASGTTGTVTYADTTNNDWISGDTGDGINVQPPTGITSADSFQVDFNFTNSVTAVNFDWVDLLDTDAIGDGPVKYSVLVGGNLIAYIESGVIGGSNTKKVKIYDATGGVRGEVTVGQGLETSFGFLLPTATSQLSLVYTTSGTISASDVHGIDGLSFSTQVSCDVDLDGIPNSLDSDSDGDGCSDADEAYYGSVNNADADNNGTYGSGSPDVNNTNGKVNAASYNTPNAYYLDASINACLDNDNDGIIDGVDLDDDNDGILDTDECAAPVVYNDSFEVPDLDALGPSGVGDVSRPDTDSDGEADMFISQTSVEGWVRTDDTNSFDIAYDIYNSSKGNQSIDLYGTPGATGIKKTFSGFTEGVPVEFSLDYSSVVDLFEATVSVDYGAGAVLLTTLAPSTTATPDSFNVVGARISKVVWVGYSASLLPTASGTIEIIIQSSSFGSGQTGVLIDNVKLSQTACKDSDNDGIQDSFDTDSDNDGCPDAIEGAGTLALDKLTTFTGGSSGGSSQNLGSNVDANGSPIVSGQGATGYTQNTTAAVLDANLNTACTTDLTITKTVDKPVLKVGQTVVFTLVLKNEGLQPATNTQVKDLLPSGLVYNLGASTIPANTTYTANTGIWDLSALTIAVNQTITLKIGATVNTVGAIITNKTEIFSLTEKDIDSTPNSNN